MNEFNFLDPFQSINVPLGQWVEVALNYLVHNFREVFRSIRWPIDQVLNGIQFGLLAIPPSIFITIATLFGWQVGGKKIGILCLVTLTLLGVIGVWNDAMITLALVLTSLFFCAVIGIPLGVLCARSDRLETVSYTHLTLPTNREV